MNRVHKAVVLEYVSSLSDDVLQFFNSRLSEKLFGDLAVSLEEFSKDKRMDNLLSNAGSSEAVFVLLDEIREIIHKEYKKKGSHLKSAAS